jgi:hypothetical protein
MLDLATVRYEQFAAGPGEGPHTTVTTDTKVIWGGTTADYADVADEEIISESPSVSASVLSV